MNNFNIPEINLEDFNYILPKEKIAIYPPSKRGDSLLLYVNPEKNEINDYKFDDISSLIPENTIIVLNDTRVIQARICGQKPTGGKMEILLIEPVLPSNDPAIALGETQETTWKCIIGGRNIKPGFISEFRSNEIILKSHVMERNEKDALVKLTWSHNLPFSKIIEIFGDIPLPPYIDRSADENDKDRYQTVFSKFEGSVAAPTAGLHFTEGKLEDVKSKGIDILKLTLHVGPGTFQPFESNEIINHKMHSEQIFISKATISELYQNIKNNKKILAVGTTSVRTLESLYWLGSKIAQDGMDSELYVNQWEPYRSENINIFPEESLKAILKYMTDMKLEYLNAYTQLLIVPGYKYNLVDMMITNFHLPKSTLILLVAAFIGKESWRTAYNHALQSDYKFLSYGDATFLKKSVEK